VKQKDDIDDRSDSNLTQFSFPINASPGDQGAHLDARAVQIP